MLIFCNMGRQVGGRHINHCRNFDFYVGDAFCRDKIIAFYRPSQGFKFMMITFGGMTGVLSGMNDQGLTVTINAAKSDIPSSLCYAGFLGGARDPSVCFDH